MGFVLLFDASGLIEDVPSFASRSSCAILEVIFLASLTIAPTCICRSAIRLLIWCVVAAHGLSLVEEILAVFHEVDFFEEELSLFSAEAFVLEHLGSSLLELVVGPLDLLDVNLLLVIHLTEPLEHDLLLT